MAQHDTRHLLSRRQTLRIGTGLAAGTAGTMALTGTPASAAPAAFAHPGLLHTQADFSRIRARLKAGAQPYEAGWAKLTANAHAQSTWTPRPQPVVYRGSGTPENYGTLYKDIHAAYQNALRWRITGESAHADAARDILNAWSAKLTKVDGNADRFIAAGIYGYQFANAAELVRDHPGFELDRFKTMMLDVLCPQSEAFLTRHNDAFITNYWASWDLLSVACVLATGILCDDRTKVERAVEYFKHGKGMGSLKNAIPVVYDGGLAQWVEAGRDQGHTLLGVGLMGTICEMAWNQGIDLYGYDDNRFLKGAEYVAKWNLGQNVPYTRFTWNYGSPSVWSGSRTLTAASGAARGLDRPIWAMIANHYVERRGLDAPHLTVIAAKSAPEGGGGDYGPNSGGYDQLGFGTLLFTRDKETATRPGGRAYASPGAAGAGNAAGASPKATATASGAGASAQGGSSDHELAESGATGPVAITAATGVLAIAGGILALRGRGRGTR